MSGPHAVLVEGLRKTYGTHEAVVDLDLAVAPGETYGFLGPNGAGKSTTIGMLCTLLRPSAGRAEVAGHDITREADAVRRGIGLVFQESTLDGELTAEENLRFQADLFGLPRARARRAISELLDLVELTHRKDSPVRTFSGGMRRRLEIARGLLHTPRVLFLDEPTTGLDPQTRVSIWEHLHRLRAEQEITIFLTTHHLEEAEHCDRMAIMDQGQLVVEGTPAGLKAVVGADLVVLRTDDDERAALAVQDRFGLKADTGPDGVRLRTQDGAGFVPRLCAELAVPVHAVTVTPPTLDDVFLHYTGRTIREADGPQQPHFGPRR
ncbi:MULTISPECIES: ATP-binding cassette domain-containing protein [Streptomyces]|uniref:ABC transporter ATP-binding protein n=2 Tax=Streptomyces TaxID=1883 RepID=A0A514JM50_9ACTN|nr:ATP-binding cassette domain-containing protein [Streptomyces calvus]MYS27133.1 ATP-binding cassette domain-containing protein [Streptomyces sp. SID7804]MBA8942568.1 ABC-2 type transport system ATP-binding protein [Streptomyces calvus]MBA8975470.1 ABC-2 type transport system ATP-binding protein [Streptomyces calvus]QDI68405.1 ABC transporter ATP-binding protein [Streptomyces calvus]GGP68585.1 daunorubicin resistance protein DrrA family ABC transporter ATP-binding protein [Streptomyces calvus